MKLLSLIILSLLTFCFTAFAQEVAPAPISGEWINVLLQVPQIIGYLSIAFGAILSIALIIPGDQPDKFLQGLVDFISKFSKK